MFGSEPGAERRQGAMNQHIVSRLLTRKFGYWVLHTRGESAVSVLIAALTKEAKQVKKMSVEDSTLWVLEMVSTIEDVKPYLTKEQFDEAKELVMTVWGTVKTTTLEVAAASATGSCVLGYCHNGE